MTGDEEQELRVLVFEAFELRGNPYVIDACGAIVDWSERLPLARFERAQEQAARVERLLRLLRETAA